MAKYYKDLRIRCSAQTIAGCVDAYELIAKQSTVGKSFSQLAGNILSAFVVSMQEGGEIPTRDEDEALELIGEDVKPRAKPRMSVADAAFITQMTGAKPPDWEDGN